MISSSDANKMLTLDRVICYVLVSKRHFHLIWFPKYFLKLNCLWGSLDLFIHEIRCKIAFGSNDLNLRINLSMMSHFPTIEQLLPVFCCYLFIVFNKYRVAQKKVYTCMQQTLTSHKSHFLLIFDGKMYINEKVIHERVYFSVCPP